ncbi:MAG: ABC transporter permease subunit [Clostridia bacterium]|nr:ABC transporter permease subunit [Clostridia bacterium]
MKKFFTERKLNIIFSVTAVLIMWLVWIIAYYSIKNDYIVPSFSDTMVSLWNCLCSGEFWTAFAFTLLRTLGAFALSFALAAVFAALSAVSKSASALIKPVMVFFRTVPTLAIILILLIWTSAKVAPIIVTVLVLFPMIYSQMTAATENVDGELIQMAKMYGVSKEERLFKIYLPQISPDVFSQTGANVSLGIKVMISAEVLANTYKSLGGMMQSARSFLEIPRLAALTLIAVLLGLVADIAFSQLKRINSKWREGAK